MFRAEGGATIGGGHVMRCRTLADEMARRGWRTALATSAGTMAHVGAWAAWPEFLVSEKPTGPGPAELAERWPSGCDLLVTDHYGIGAVYERACRTWADHVLAIDDLADRQHDCDLLLDQTLGRAQCDYRGYVPGGCDILVGPHHALLRPDFTALRSAALARRGLVTERPRVLVALGFANQGTLLHRIVDTLLATGLLASIDVVTGRDRMSRDITDQLRWHGRITNMAAIMAQADIAVGAAGISTWERCCLGLPTLMVVLADNQDATARAIDAAGAGLSLGPVSSDLPDRLAVAFRRLLAEEPLRRAMAERAGSICDGRGTERVADAVEALCKPD